MTLHLCHACTTIYEVPDGLPLVCPKCRHILIDGDDGKFDSAVPFNVIASWALFGLPERERGR